MFGNNKNLHSTKDVIDKLAQAMRETSETRLDEFMLLNTLATVGRILNIPPAEMFKKFRDYDANREYLKGFIDGAKQDILEQIKNM